MTTTDLHLISRP